MNRSGIQFAVFMSCVRRRSSPVFLRSSRNSSMSRCHVSRYVHTAPLRLPPWLTATAVSFTTLRNGTTPCDLPLVPLMCEPMRAHVGPVVAEAAGELGQQRVFLDRLVDAVEVVATPW